jgi:hypothetical protein
MRHQSYDFELFKLSEDVESFLEKFRHFDPLAELDLVDGVLMVFCATDELNALIKSSKNKNG